MVSLQLEKAVLKEKVKTCDDLSSFLKEKDVDQDVLELINEFQGLLSAKKTVNKVGKKKTVSKDGKKKKSPSFWNNFLKENMPVVKDEQKGLKEGDEGWIEKEGRWEMSEIAKRWAKFKQQDDFKEKEREYKQSLTDLSSDDNDDNDDNDVTDAEIQLKKQPKKQAKKQAKKQPKKQPKKQQETIDTDSDDDSDNDDDNGLAKVQPVVEQNDDSDDESDDESDNDSDDGSEPDDDSDNDSDNDSDDE